MRPEIKELVHRLFLIPGASAPKAVVLCGITATLEANSIALLAAEALCTLGQPSVCLIDAKVASPTFHEVFDLTNKHGLTTALLSDAPIQSFGRRLPNLNLLVIPSGPEIAGWEALLSSGAMATRIDELLQQFTHVLIEAPSIGESQVAVALGRAADGVVLVVEADETRRELAMKAKQELEQSNVRLLGAVLNNRRFPIPQRLYSRL
ncbi:MAG TPA: cellulose synthase operon protein YhjQ/BcsQ [Clostridia bacterium]|nr:cellulose synthase operon protein YhjQ/BcsQ [Clostridia bacterium]